MSAPTRRPARVGRRGRGSGPAEHGSVLVLALVFVVIVGLLGVQVLAQESTTSAAHANAYRPSRNLALTGDAAIDAIVQAIRSHPTMGAVGSYGSTCNGGADPLHPAATQLATYGSGSSLVTVYCTPDVTSGALQGVEGGAPDAAVQTLGGLAPAGNQYGNTTAANDAIPFCDDWEDTSGNTCEAGLYVGNVADTTTLTGGGLYIGGKVTSNSAIIVRANSTTLRQVKVAGTVSARRACGANITGAAINTDSSGNFYVMAGFDPVSTPNGLAPSCNGEQPSNHGTLDASDPRYVHAAIPSNPVDARTAAPAGYYPSGNALDPQRCVAGNGYVQMPPGWYDNVTDLDNMMADARCQDTLFHFEPGVYYFDFTDVGPATKWVEPKGVAWTDRPGQIVGGTPKDWNPCAPCAQPEKVMILNKLSGSSNISAADAAEAVNIDPPGPTSVGTTLLLNGNGMWTQQTNVQTPIPVPDPNSPAKSEITSVDSLKLEVAYNLPGSKYQPNAGSLYVAPDDNVPKRSGADVDVSFSSNGFAGHCYIFLDPGLHNGPVWVDANGAFRPNVASPRPVPDTLPAPDADQQLDLTSGCNPTVLGSHYIGSTGSFPITSGVWSQHPDWVNNLKVQFNVKPTVTTSDSKSAPEVDINGLQFAVSWTGRPSPPFPNGCDRTKDGVELVFGNVSRMEFGVNQNPDFVELCASDQGRSWAGTSQQAPAGNGQGLAMGIYGLSEASVSPPCVWHSTGTPDPSPVPSCPAQPAVTLTPYTAPGSQTALFPATMSTYQTIDGSVGVASWSNDNPARVSFTLPGIANVVPASSVITGVTVAVRHAEGAASSPSGTADLSPITKVTLNITPGNLAPTTNGYSSVAWSTGDASVPTNPSMPKCADLTNLCTWRWGVALPPTGPPNPTDRNTAPNHSDVYDSGYAEPWYEQRTLPADLNSPEGLANALFTYEVDVKNGDRSQKFAELDGIELTVTYRPAGLPRPLAGCLTTRSLFYPGMPYASSPSWTTATSPGSPNAGTSPGLDAIGLDRDWNPSPGAAGTSDDSYSPQGSGGGCGNGTGDGRAWPLVFVNKYVKFHVQGTAYAPIAALDLSGNDNDAAWFSDSIVARQLTAMRWKQGTTNVGLLPAVRDSSLVRNDRLVTLTAQRALPGGACQVIVQARVAIHDPPGDPGASTRVDSWIRNPGTPCS